MARRIAVVLLLLAGLSVALKAQTITPDAQASRALARRLDQMAAAVNGGTESGLRSNIDFSVNFQDPEWGWITAFMGWSVSCQAGANGYPKAMDIYLDGRLVGSSDDEYDYRVAVDFFLDRPDVRSIVSAWGGMWPQCVPQKPQFAFMLSTEDLEPGSMHVVQLRTWNTATWKSAWSPAFIFSR